MNSSILKIVLMLALLQRLAFVSTVEGMVLLSFCKKSEILFVQTTCNKFWLNHHYIVHSLHNNTINKTKM